MPRTLLPHKDLLPRRPPLPWEATQCDLDAHSHLLLKLRAEALVVEPVTLSSGAQADYYIDAKRALLNPSVFQAVGLLISAAADHYGATAVGGLTMGADPVAYSSLAVNQHITAFSVRKERKDHGLQRWIEGPEIGPEEICLVVDDVVTEGSSVLDAIDRMWQENLRIAAVVTVVDRLAGGKERIEAETGVHVHALTTVDHVFPERPDRV